MGSDAAGLCDDRCDAGKEDLMAKSNPQDDFAFKVIWPATGHEFKIWANGQIEGFGFGCVVVNKIPALLLRACEEADRVRREGNGGPEDLGDGR